MFQYKMTISKKSAPKWSFYIFDFGTYQLKVLALDLKTLKKFKVNGGYKKTEFSGNS
jgi:hypothetical protein